VPGQPDGGGQGALPGAAVVDVDLAAGDQPGVVELGQFLADGPLRLAWHARPGQERHHQDAGAVEQPQDGVVDVDEAGLAGRRLLLPPCDASHPIDQRELAQRSGRRPPLRGVRMLPAGVGSAEHAQRRAVEVGVAAGRLLGEEPLYWNCARSIATLVARRRSFVHRRLGRCDRAWLIRGVLGASAERGE